MAVVVIKIHGHDDLQVLEMEICRLLRCDRGRRPACLCTQDFWKFQASILQKLFLGSMCNSAAVDAPLKCFLPQKLVAYVPQSHDAEAVHVHLAWDYSTVADMDVELKNHRESSAGESRKRKLPDRVCASDDIGCSQNSAAPLIDTHCDKMGEELHVLIAD